MFPNQGEIDTILNLGVQPEDIIYANPCKTKNFVRHAASVGVDTMTFDNEAELQKVAQHHPSAKMVIRIKVDDSHSVCQFSAKFGADVSNARHLLQVAKSMGVEVVGVSFHVGSGCESANSFHDAIRDARLVFDQGLELGFHMSLLDLGGGWPGTTDPAVSFEDMAQVVRGALDEYFPATGDQATSVKIIAEPGRYYVASAFSLAVNVIAKKVLGTSENPSIMYYVNDGVYGSFNCIIYDHVSPIATSFLPADQVGQRPVLPSTIWGPTCDSMDQLAKDVPLPELQVGEWMVYYEMGAYTIAAASKFNGFEIPTLKYFLTPYTMQTLRDMPRWPVIAQILDHDREACLTPVSDEEFGFKSMDIDMITVQYNNALV